MTEAGDQLAVTCPACSPGVETVHEVLSPGGQPTVRCHECGHVHATSAGWSPPSRPVRTIVSQADESIAATVDVPEGVVLERGDRFVVETDEAVYSVELTSIEDADGRRHDRLGVDRIETLWTRDIGNVSVDVTVHPPPRSGRSSHSVRLRLPGDEELVVGDEMSVDDEPVRVVGLLLRGEAVAAGAKRKLDDRGSSAPAMDLERVYARSREADGRSAW